MGGLVLDEQIKPLSVKERQRLNKLEGVITKNLEGFIAVCLAFAEIKDSLLYREKSQTIEEYARQEFDLSRSSFDKLADGGKLLQFADSCPQIEWQPTSKAQLRPLVPVFKKNPEKLAEIIELAVETAPDGKITAAHISQVVKKQAGDQIKNKIAKIKRSSQKIAKISPEFKAAFTSLLDVINTENFSGWKTTDQTEASRHLSGLLAAIEG